MNEYNSAIYVSLPMDILPTKEFSQSLRKMNEKHMLIINEEVVFDETLKASGTQV